MNTPNPSAPKLELFSVVMPARDEEGIIARHCWNICIWNSR